MKISERLLLIRKTTTDYLLGYSDLKKRHFKLTTRDLSEQKELRADPKAIQQINFTEKFNYVGNTIFIIFKEVEKYLLPVRQEYCRCNFISNLIQ